MLLRVKPTQTRFPTDSLHAPMDNTPLHSISSVCRPWDGVLRLRSLPELSACMAADWLLQGHHRYDLTFQSKNAKRCLSVEFISLILHDC